MARKQTFKYSVRNKLLEQKIRGTPRSQIVGVAIDIAKDFHKVLIFDFNGKIIHKPFSIDVFVTGYEKLKDKILKAKKKRKAKQVFIGLEPCGCFGHQLTRCLKRDFKEVFLINPIATSSNRTQKMLLGLKTDDIDLCSIGDLLIRGECYPCRPQKGVYQDLQENTYWREKKLKILTAFKLQVISRITKIFPGLDSKFEGNRPLFGHPFKSKLFWAAIDFGSNLSQSKRMSVDGIIRFFGERNSRISKEKAVRTKKYFNNLLIDEPTISRDVELLRKDMRLVKFLSKEISEIEEEMICLVKQTPARYVTGEISGLNDLALASYMGCIGDISSYKNAGKIFSKAGLCPKIRQSGNAQGKNLGIKKAGNKLLRTRLFKMSVAVKSHEPYFKDYYDHLIKNRKKPWLKAVIAVSRKLNNVMFAMMKNKTSFEPPTRRLRVESKPKKAALTAEASPVLR